MKTFAKIITMLCIMGIGQQYTYAQVSVGISVRIAPPALPIYTQPECPVDGYIWQPGYWAYDNVEGYYWVPGLWIAPPQIGLYWTPAYWGYSGGYYGFYPGYWGPHVGYYGGINYGCGYNGYGYAGGRWDGGRFRYNTAVTRINRTVIRNTYIDRTVIRGNNNRASFNGPGGVNASPRPQELLAAKDRHIQATSNQMSHQAAARGDRNSFVKVNHGRPATPAIKGSPANPGNGGQHNLNSGRQTPNTKLTPGNRPQSQSPQQHMQQRQQQPQQMQRQQQAQQRNSQQQQRQQQPQQMQRQQQAQQHMQQQRQAPPQMQQQRQQPQMHQQMAPQPHNEPHPGGGGEHGGGERR